MFHRHKTVAKGIMQVLLLISISLPQIICAIDPYLPPLDPLDKIPNKRTTLQPCEICRVLVLSFLTAVDETSRGAFAGGDAFWEENKLGSYANSELRFIEIQEQLCSDVKSGKDQCHIVAEEQEELLEKWFYEKRNQNIDLLQYLCIDHLKICCPDNTYGPSCQPCAGGIELPCNGHGSCQGNGTRKGTGKCICHSGYTGKLCNQCQKGYYQNENSSSVICELCDHACKDHCRGPGPKACEICADGFHHLPEQGCVEDLDDQEMEEDDFNETSEEEDMKGPAINFDSANAQDKQHSEF